MKLVNCAPFHVRWFQNSPERTNNFGFVLIFAKMSNLIGKTGVKNKWKRKTFVTLIQCDKKWYAIECEQPGNANDLYGAKLEYCWTQYEEYTIRSLWRASNIQTMWLLRIRLFIMRSLNRKDNFSSSSVFFSLSRLAL